MTWTLHLGDAVDVLRTLPDASVDAVVTDPPAGISFMQKTWDKPSVLGVSGGVAMPATTSSRNPSCRVCGGRKRAGPATKACKCEAPDWNDTEWRLRDRMLFVSWLASAMRECLRVLQPGGHALVWALPRTSHWTATAIEDAGFELRDCVTHIFGCLSDDTEILVDGRWEPYQKAEAGRLALCYHAEDDTFCWQPIKRLYTYQHDGAVYHLRGERTDQVVTVGHRCLVEQGGAYALVCAEEAAREHEARVPVLEDVRGLLASLPLPQPLAGCPQPDVFPGVCGGEDEPRAHREEVQAVADLSGVQTTLPSQEQRGTVSSEVLHARLLRDVEGTRPSDATTTAEGGGKRSSWLDSREHGDLPCEDDRSRQPGMEGRRDLLPQARQLQADQVRPLFAGVLADGAEGRLRDGAPPTCGEGDGPLSAAPRDSASRQPQPTGQCADEPHAVRRQPAPQAIRGARFTTPDLARFDLVHYTGTVWCVEVPAGAFVARRNGHVFVTGNSGFPKSLDVSKAIDKAAGAKREAVGKNPNWRDPDKNAEHHEKWNGAVMSQDVTFPATDAAKRWDGWGTALKPATEHWWLARKPLDGTVAANVLQHGLGALNIEACRVGEMKRVPSSPSRRNLADLDCGWGLKAKEDVPGRNPNIGRWPTNLLISHAPSCRLAGTRMVKGDNRLGGDGTRPGGFGDVGAGGGNGKPAGTLHGDAEVEAWDCAEGCPVAELDRQSGDLTSGDLRPEHVARATSAPFQNVYGVMEKRVLSGAGYAANTGGASRFFPTFGYEDADFVPFRYVAKPSRGERDEGLDHLLVATGGEATDREDGTAGLQNPRAGAGRTGGVRNIHPTVKSIALMSWLCKLVTPPGGTVLDPFLGSGTTIIAALRCGFNAIGIERESNYMEIARARIEEDAPLFRRTIPLARAPKPRQAELELTEDA